MLKTVGGLGWRRTKSRKKRKGEEESMEGGKTTLIWIGGDTLTKRSS